MSTAKQPAPNQQAQPSHDASLLYEQVQALLQQGDVSGAQQASAQITHIDYKGFALREVAQAQLQAGDVAGAEATAQGMPYPDAQGDVLGKVAKVHLTRGNLAKAQELAATISYTNAWPSLTSAIAEVQARAGAAQEARQTLTAAQQHLQTWSDGDHWNGYPREEALYQIVQAQLSIGDLPGATQTALSMSQPAEQNRAFRAIQELTPIAADNAQQDAGPA